MQDEKEFYMVWNPNGRAPTFKHATKDSAITEAKRLTDTYSQKFYVLQALFAVEQPPKILVTRLTHYLDETIPF